MSRVGIKCIDLCSEVGCINGASLPKTLKIDCLFVYMYVCMVPANRDNEEKGALVIK